MTTVVGRAGGMCDILGAIRNGSRAFKAVRPPAVGAPVPKAEHGRMPLTARELSVVTLVGAGCTSREISVRMSISHKTVENHKQRIFRKLGVQNQAHAVSVAMRSGLLRPDRVIDAASGD